MDISLYGSTGFVGSIFYQRQTNLPDLFLDKIYKVPRWKRKPAPNTDILYMISTVHNYNVFQDATIDVNTNLMVLGETLDSWRHNNPEKVFNFISSWFVYGNEYPAYGHERMVLAFDECWGQGYYTKNGGALETDECHPRGFYSITKYAAEQLVRSYAETFNLKYRILRLSNVVGRGDKKVSKQKNAFQYLLGELWHNRPIQLYDGGNFKRDFIHVYDACDVIRLVMRDGDLNTIYNIGSGIGKHFGDAIHEAADMLKSKSVITNIEQPDFHKTVQAKSFYMDIEKLQDLGFKAMPWEMVLRAIIPT